mmetsp:Transcript_58952/g.140739  ORF Transcript_58952/g.140739 Transcript_58952/m.140739 type:complete len:444 (+) Transcript_58952:54-1385(+)
MVEAPARRRSVSQEQPIFYSSGSSLPLEFSFKRRVSTAGQTLPTVPAGGAEDPAIDEAGLAHADPRLLEMWREFDADGSGVISLQEFVVGLTDIVGLKPSTEAVEAILAEVDTDRSGSIEFSEFCHFFAKLGELDDFRRKQDAKLRATLCLTVGLITTSFGVFFTLVMMDVSTPSDERDTDRYAAVKTGELISGIVLAIFFCQAIVVPIILWKCKKIPCVAGFVRLLEYQQTKPTEPAIPLEVAKKLGQKDQLKILEKKLPVRRVRVRKDFVQPTVTKANTYRPESAHTGSTQLAGGAVASGAATPKSPSQSGQLALVSGLQPLKLPGSPGGAPPLLDTADVEASHHIPRPHIPQHRTLHRPIKPDQGWSVEVYTPERYAWMQEVQQSYVQAPMGFHGIKGGSSGRPQEAVVDSKMIYTGDIFSRAHMMANSNSRRESEFEVT